MEIQFATDLQKHIADLMWKANGKDDVKAIIRVYGKEAEVVFHMIMAAFYDEDMTIDMSAPIIDAIRQM